MSRESTIMNLLPDIYAATEHNPDKFKPADPRRVRRLLRLDNEDTETLNRGIAALMASTDYYRERMGMKKRKY